VVYSFAIATPHITTITTKDWDAGGSIRNHNGIRSFTDTRYSHRGSIDTVPVGNLAYGVSRLEERNLGRSV